LVTEACSAASCKRFVATDTAVTDYQTGLLWQRSPSETQLNWKDAGAYCAALNLAPFSSGWRLPTGNELSGIIDRSRTNPSIDVEAFPNTPSASFFSSTAYGNQGQAYCGLFDIGTLAAGCLMERPAWVRCVH
jgi:hypothetical protein